MVTNIHAKTSAHTKEKQKCKNKNKKAQGNPRGLYPPSLVSFHSKHGSRCQTEIASRHRGCSPPQLNFRTPSTLAGHRVSRRRAIAGSSTKSTRETSGSNRRLTHRTREQLAGATRHPRARRGGWTTARWTGRDRVTDKVVPSSKVR